MGGAGNGMGLLTMGPSSVINITDRLTSVRGNLKDALWSPAFVLTAGTGSDWMDGWIINLFNNNTKCVRGVGVLFMTNRRTGGGWQIKEWLRNGFVYF